jgi:hypothetical protein
MRELEAYNKRILRIIGITQKEAVSQFNIPPPTVIIDKHCTKTMKRALSNSTHPLTRQLSTSNLKAKFKFRHPIPNTTAYSNSFVPKYLAAVRGGTVDLYKCNKTTKNRLTNKHRKVPKNNIKQKCHICGKEFSRVKTHITKMHTKFSHF